jgi:hypothetical protein
MFAICCGYEDADDLDHLRCDPAFKLIFYSANSQAIECTWKSAPTKRLGTTFRMISRDWDQVSAT